MSKFNSVVPVPLGEIRRLDGKLGSAMKPGTLVTAVGAFGGGSSTHIQPDYPNALFTANGVGNTTGVLIVMNQDDLVTAEIYDDLPINSHARAHVLKSGEEVTVIMSEAAVINAGDKLYPAANGKVAKVVDDEVPMFQAIETCAADSTGDDLRILARVL